MRGAGVTVAGTAAVPSRVARLLPGFDPYVIGALGQLDRLLPSPGLRSAVSRTSGWISPVLDGGRIAGTWTQDVTAGGLAISIIPFGQLRPGVAEAAEAEAVRWATYADAPPPHLEPVEDPGPSGSGQTAAPPACRRGRGSSYRA